MSLTVSHCCKLSLTVSPSPMECHWLLLVVSHCLSNATELLDVSHIPECWVQYSCCMFLTFFNGCWLSLAVSSSAMEVLRISHYFSLLIAVSHCLSKCHGVAVCCSLSPTVAGYLSLFLLAHVSHCLTLCLSQSCCMSLAVSHGCCMSLTVSPSAMELRDSQQL